MKFLVTIILKNALIFVFLGLVLLLTEGHAETSVRSGNPAIRPVIKGFVNPELFFVAWLNKPWTGDDAPYANARKLVEQAAQSGRLEPTVERYQAEYKADPTNLTVQITYVYAIWLNQWLNDIPFTDEEQADMSVFCDEVWRKPHPNTYNYTRMASLCWGTFVIDRNLYPFLERLTQADPTDIYAGHFVPSMLAATGKPALQLQAITEANSLVEKYPNVPALLTVQGYAYYSRWRVTKDPVMAQKAITAYQNFLARDPPNGYFRPAANMVIGILEKGH